MNFFLYIKDKTISIFSYILTITITVTFLKIIKVPLLIMTLILVFLCLNGTFIFVFEYLKKYRFYRDLNKNLLELDKKYLVLETITKPSNYEQKMIYDALYEIDKSMVDSINKYKNNIYDYKEFLELWIHEVKLPISSMMLLYHNHQDKYDKKMFNILLKLDNLIDEILYYVRSEYTEKDFVISKVNLKDIIKEITIKNKDLFLENKVRLELDMNNVEINTDKKWLEFIINQIINNSIKYKKEKDSLVKISSYEKNEIVFLEIYDNGIGIDKKDISRVFEKSYTGTNGRNSSKSTGMGLYIVKNLCEKLGHNISIESKKNEYTKIIIKFGKNNFYNI